MPLRILVVEDEASNLQIIGMNLAMLGYEVLEAINPTRGLELARDAQPDLILMDMMFKGAAFDGLEAIRRLKADPLTRHIPIVAQTASVLDYRAPEVAAAGAAGLLHKPFRRVQLVAAIREACPDSAEPWGRLRAADVHLSQLAARQNG